MALVNVNSVLENLVTGKVLLWTLVTVPTVLQNLLIVSSLLETLENSNSF